MAHFAANYVANLIPGALFHPLGEGGLGKKKKLETRVGGQPPRGVIFRE